MTDQLTEPYLLDEREPSEQTAGRFVGMAVFLAGIVMMALAFFIAYKGFANPEIIVPRAYLTGERAVRPEAIYLPVVLKLLLLFVMGYVASQIASRGAQMFFSAKRERSRGNTRD
jgi:hypothetical protein